MNSWQSPGTYEGPDMKDNLDWAVGRWKGEVLERPMSNIYRRVLDDTWRQVIRRFGGNDRELLPLAPHDELL